MRCKLFFIISTLAFFALANPLHAACDFTQADLGTSSSPKKWNIRGNGENNTFFDCTFISRAYNDLRGQCFAKNVPLSSIIRTKSTMRLNPDTCALAFTLQTSNLKVRGNGKFGPGLTGGTAASGTASILIPASNKIQYWKMWGLQL